jgi:hypothetical protein
VGSSCGTTGEEGTISCCLPLKKSRNCWRTALASIDLGFRSGKTRSGQRSAASLPGPRVAYSAMGGGYRLADASPTSPGSGTPGALLGKGESATIRREAWVRCVRWRDFAPSVLRGGVTWGRGDMPGPVACAPGSDLRCLVVRGCSQCMAACCAWAFAFGGYPAGRCGGWRGAFARYPRIEISRRRRALMARRYDIVVIGGGHAGDGGGMGGCASLGARHRAGHDGACAAIGRMSCNPGDRRDRQRTNGPRDRRAGRDHGAAAAIAAGIQFRMLNRTQGTGCLGAARPSRPRSSTPSAVQNDAGGYARAISKSSKASWTKSRSRTPTSRRRVNVRCVRLADGRTLDLRRR